jgi:hypothetical protein
MKVCSICGDSWPHTDPKFHDGAADLWTGMPLVPQPQYRCDKHPDRVLVLPDACPGCLEEKFGDPWE